VNHKISGWVTVCYLSYSFLLITLAAKVKEPIKINVVFWVA